MKKNEVPQDESPISKHGSNELVYAVDENGKMTAVQSKGWKPKSDIQYQNLEHLNQLAEEAKQLVLQGKYSPVVYYMEVHKMDWQTLAAYLNKWTFLVKRHQKPSVFKRLSEKTLQKYAAVFEISVDDLKNFKG
ncbi:MAG TPA: hypothetical protein VKY33_01980 [Flavobacterium sp.]|nr:hypothetical protein [Flavobacterium sp.]